MDAKIQKYTIMTQLKKGEPGMVFANFEFKEREMAKRHVKLLRRGGKYHAVELYVTVMDQILVK